MELMIWNAALTVFLALIGWAVRAKDEWEPNIGEVVDYLTFSGEAKLAQPMGGEAGFPKKFAERGPRDSKGRSLRDLNLKTRVFEYPVSYMIYSEAFDALPQQAKAAVYKRVWQVLSAKKTPEAQAAIEILRDTKPEVREYFR